MSHTTEENHEDIYLFIYLFIAGFQASAAK